MKKYAILTSNSKRHAYFANKISEFFNVNLVIIEEKEKLKGRSLIRENDFFSQYQHVGHSITVPQGCINADKIRDALRKSKIDIAFVFGTGILKKEDWKSGNNIWHIETIAKKNLRNIMSWTKDFFSSRLEEGTPVHWLRVKDNKPYRQATRYTREFYKWVR